MGTAEAQGRGRRNSPGGLVKALLPVPFQCTIKSTSFLFSFNYIYICASCKISGKLSSEVQQCCYSHLNILKIMWLCEYTQNQ